MNLQKAPIGLLGALELKVTGKNPDGFEDAVRGAYDVSDFYGLTTLQTVLASGNITSAGDQLTLSVPQGKIYRVHSMAFRMACNAGDMVGGFLAWQLNQTSVAAALHADNGSEVAIAVAFAANWCCAIRFNRPLLAPPGCILSWYQGTAVGAARASSLTLQTEVFDA